MKQMFFPSNISQRNSSLVMKVSECLNISTLSTRSNRVSSIKVFPSNTFIDQSQTMKSTLMRATSIAEWIMIRRLQLHHRRNQETNKIVSPFQRNQQVRISLIFIYYIIIMLYISWYDSNDPSTSDWFSDVHAQSSIIIDS